MKSFFKKIGRGLKKLGRNISRVMNSKVGRIIGTVALAYGMYGIFKSIYQGINAAKTASLAAKEGGEKLLEETTKKVVEESTKEAARTISEGSAAEVFSKVDNLVKTTNPKAVKGMMDGTLNATNFSSVSESTRTGLSLVGDTTVDSAISAQTFAGTTEQTATNVFAQGQKDIDMIAKFSMQEGAEQTATDVLTNKFRDITGITGEFTAQEQNLLDQYIASQKPGFDKYLSNPANREAYDQATRVFTDGMPGELTGQATKLGMPTSGEIAATPYRTFGEAFASGEGALQKIGNVAEQALSNDIATLTRGAYTGPLSGTSTIGAATTASSLLSPTEEVGTYTQQNYVAAQQASAQQQVAEDLASTPTIAPLMAMPDEMLSSSNPLATFNQIRSNAGFGQLFGPLYQFS